MEVSFSYASKLLTHFETPHSEVYKIISEEWKDYKKHLLKSVTDALHTTSMGEFTV